MLTLAPIKDQLSLLLIQREQMCTSRYVGLEQMTRHDQKMVSHLRILQSELSLKEVGDSPEAAWLLDQAPNLGQLFQLEGGYEQQAFLYQLKAYHHQSGFTDAIVECLRLEPDHAACWGLLQYCMDDFWAAQHQLPMAHCPDTVKAALRLPVDARYNSESECFESSQVVMACLKGEQLDTQRVALKLMEHQQLSFQVLAFLMLSAGEDEQLHLINSLSRQPDLTAAIWAMGMGGQQRYLPVLLELSQDSDWREAAADSLTVLLGVLAADATMANGLSVTDPVYLQQAFQASGALWAASDVTLAQLQSMWVHGNQIQRQLAAIKATLRSPTLPLLNCSSLWGGVWHTAST